MKLKKNLILYIMEKINKEIWKFKVDVLDETTINMPINSEILCVQTQYNNPFIWALVDPKEEKEDRTFEIYGTGQNIEFKLGSVRNYIGTFQLHNGSLAFHLFERTL